MLNAGAAIYACRRADSLDAGARAAEAAIDEGAAAAALERFVARHRRSSRAAHEGPGPHRRVDTDTTSTAGSARCPAPSSSGELAAPRDDRPFSEAVGGSRRIGLIAEHKRRSPSAGDMHAGSSVKEIVQAYERGGAAALSIVTEPRHFGGSLDDLREARAASKLPLLRKDFVVDTYQVYESAAAGADALLLIVAALEPRDLRRLHEESRALDLDVLVEVHDERELEAALEVDAEVIGINNRDLTDFSRGHRAHIRAARGRSGRQGGRGRVGLSRTASSSRSSIASAWTPPSSASR